MGTALGAVLLAGAVSVGTSSAAFAADSEQIRSFASAITVDADGVLHVKETIQYQFEGEHHGIERELVTAQSTNREDGKLRLYPVSDIEVSSPSHAPADSDVSESDASTTIRIGDPHKSVSGTQTYVISYTVRGAFNRFTEPVTEPDGTTLPPHDELYWNVTGNAWNVPIVAASATVTATQPATAAQCYKGGRGSTDTCPATAGATSTFSTTGLGEQQGMTILLAYPLNMVSDAAPILADPPRHGISQLLDVSPISLGGAVLVLAAIVGGMAWLVRRRGRDAAYVGLTPGLMPVHGQQAGERPVTRQPKDVAVQFTPPAGLHPGQIGTLIDEVANPVDVTATIIDLAVRGFLKIEEITNDAGTKVKDWRLSVVSPAPAEQLEPYELALLQALFKGRNDVELKGELRNTFAGDLKATQTRLYDDVTQRGWFRGNPESVRGLYRMLGLALMGLGFVGVFFSSLTHLNFLVPSAAVFLGGLVVLLMAKRMPARTASGTAVLTQAQGFRRYLETAEADQIRFEEGQDLFSRYLPYAIVFGVADRWARVFDDLAKSGAAVSQPSWYVGHSPVWSYYWLSASMNSFETTSNSSLVSTPASSGSSGFSSGGGFSGGGGGGGGGGSW
ncbi:DUF2207 domain-containing protein [Angustibacter sp. McL0619]|uniref:DUF2207 domain-containing protein n=1 Tax=Angustibacter sp. McL0619 TaxID=3415676 RepID=UPI003CF1B187